MKVLLTVPLLLVLGCQCQSQRATLRDAMDQATQTIRADQKDWASKLVLDPATGKDHRDQLPTLTQTQYNQILRAHSEYENLVQEDRNRDAGSTTKP